MSHRGWFGGIFVSLALFILFLGIVLGAAFGFIEAGLAAEIVMGAVALVGLFALLKLPWDLHFRARAVAVEQRESLAKGISIPEDAQRAVQTLSYRTLALCLGLHLGGAFLLSIASFATEGMVGYAFASFYLVSTVLRPVEAIYRHVAARLFELSSRAHYPREDVLAWVDAVNRLDTASNEHRLRLAGIERHLTRAREESTSKITEVDERARTSERALDRKLDRVLRELERTADRIGEGRELVSGLRALARLLKESDELPST